jgi:phosphoglycolate phosphatase-like HAD superfamily hydrolase
MSDAVVFAERALAPGGDAIWPAALEHLSRRFAAIRALDVGAVPARESAVAALEDWAGDDVSSWRLELGRFYDDHARMHLRRDPATAALLSSLRARGVRLAAYGQGPREASAVTFAFLGLDRRLDAVVLEPDGDPYAACLKALGAGEARSVTSRDELAALRASS